jgi:hypothetical protein
LGEKLDGEVDVVVFPPMTAVEVALGVDLVLSLLLLVVSARVGVGADRTD